MDKAQGSLTLEGHIKMEIVRNGVLIDTLETKNLIVNEGLNYALDLALATGDAATEDDTWYVAVLNNYTPVAGTTMTNIGGNEFTNYSEATRSAYTGVRTSQTVSNTASKASFTINAASQTIYGAAIVSDSTKSGTSGTCFAAGLFGTARSGLESGDQVFITYDITAASA